MAVSSDSAHHPVQPVCVTIVLNIYYYNETALCKSIISGGGGVCSQTLRAGRLGAASVGSGLET